MEGEYEIGVGRGGSWQSQDLLAKAIEQGQATCSYIKNKTTSNPWPHHLVALEEKRIYDGIFRGNGDVNPYGIRQELTDTLNNKAYVYRNETDLVDGLKKVRELKKQAWKHVDDKAKEYNTNFANVMELDSMFRVAEVILVGAINRKESRGAHAHEDFTERDDKNWMKHTIMWLDENNKSTLSYRDVTMTTLTNEVESIPPVERVY